MSAIVRKFFIFILTLLFIITDIHIMHAAETKQNESSQSPDFSVGIIDQLLHITCETEGLAHLVRNEYSHTCLRLPASSFILNQIVSPISSLAIPRLKLDDDGIKGIENACAIKNQIDYQDKKITFAYCNNVLLATNTLKHLIELFPDLVSGIFKGGKFDWSKIAEKWHKNFDKNAYHIVERDKKPGDTGIIVDIGIPAVFIWKVTDHGDLVCVSSPGLTGFTPVGCKFVSDPFPKSIYSDFIEDDYDDPSQTKDSNNITQCSGISGCFKDVNANSKSALVMSGPIVECMRRMIAKAITTNNVCAYQDIYEELYSNKKSTSTLFAFQRTMVSFVKLMLMIYVIINALNIMLSFEEIQRNQMIMMFIKSIFVIYFSIGISVNRNTSGDVVSVDGLTTLLMPALFSFMEQAVSWMSSFNSSGLCNFSIDEYKAGYEYLYIWDSLDCKVSYYLGLDLVFATLTGGVKESLQSFTNIPVYLQLVVPLLVTQNYYMAIMVITYPLMIVSIVAFVVNMSIICIILITILCILAPVFVPMLLFSYTKNYFDNWMKLMISFAMQPMVAMLFLHMVFSVYDLAFYTSCKFDSVDGVVYDRPVRYFTIDREWSKYETDEARENCQMSLGNMFGDKHGTIINIVKQITNKSFLDTLWRIMMSFLTANMLLFVMKTLAEQITELIADVTNSISLAGMGTGAMKLYNQGKALANAAAGRAGAGKDIGKPPAGNRSSGIQYNAQSGGGKSSASYSTGNSSSSNNKSSASYSTGSSSSSDNKSSGISYSAGSNNESKSPSEANESSGNNSEEASSSDAPPPSAVYSAGSAADINSQSDDSADKNNESD